MLIHENWLKNFDLSGLKSVIDTLDIDKLKTVRDNIKTITIDLKKLSDVVDKDVAKKTVHNQLFTKVLNL